MTTLSYSTFRPIPIPLSQLEELKKFGGKVLQTSLKHDDEDKLRAALEAAKSSIKAVE